MKSQEQRILQTARWCLLSVFLAGLGSVASGAAPCCGIKGIDQRSGVVTAVDSASGRTFQFKVEDATLLASLRVGQKVYANFGAGKVSVNGATPCCGIVPAGEAPGAAKLGAPCCSIKSIDRSAGMVTASDSVSGRTFQFKVEDSGLLGSLSVGQKVYANLGAGKVSVDGGTPCCSIVAEVQARAAAKPVGPCCGIKSIDQRTGVVTAADGASGRTFQFAVTDARLLKSLKLGQAIWADFAARTISVDGITPCCGIK